MTFWLAAGGKLTREITEEQKRCLTKLGLVLPCHGCTEECDDPVNDVVYHPDCTERDEKVVRKEIASALYDKRH